MLIIENKAKKIPNRNDKGFFIYYKLFSIYGKKQLCSFLLIIIIKNRN